MKSMFKTLLGGAVLALPLLTITGGAAAQDKPAAKATTAQPGAAKSDAAKSAAEKPGAKPWTPKRTPWGDPDLRGRWPLDYLAQTPRIRPEQYGDRAELTDAEYATAMRNAKQQAGLYDREEKAGKIGMGHWTERGQPLRQTSLTVVPANGRMPPATPEGVKRSADMRSSWTEQHWNWVDDFNTFDRCITRGLPQSMLPGVYNSGIELMQGPGYVAIRLEMIHETRIIPLDGRAKPAAALKNWMGISRGHWEGNTLVIETTNFVPNMPLGNTGQSPRPVPNSDQMKMTERLTPTGPNNIRYEAWVEDPVTLTAPFKLDFPWQRNDDYEFFEYACHEGNVQLRGFITSTSTNPRLVAAREAKWKAQEAERLQTASASAPAKVN